MRLVVTGSKGQVATALQERGAAQGVTVIALPRPDFDLLRPETISPAILAARPDVVVSAAAYTMVDKAESEEDVALAVNGVGAGLVAEAARRAGAPVIHLSTDYVFDGAGETPFREDDPVGPIGAYGRTKLEGERRVAAAHPDHAILRTAWVYAPYGANFIRTMLRLAETRDVVRVVADQHGSPTSALDIADGVIQVARNLTASPGEARLRGLFHMTGAGYATWAGFAAHVFAVSERAGGPHARVEEIATSDYPTPARRPANSRLDGARLAAVHGVRLPDWRVSVETCIRRLLGAA